MKRNIFSRHTTQKRSVVWVNDNAFAECITSGYRPLTKCPEIIAGCLRIAELISSMTIYLMANTERGDIRVINELSRKIDIEPNKNMTRRTFMSAVVMNMLLYGKGNAVVIPHTHDGFLDSLEVVPADKVEFSEIIGKDDYRIRINNISRNPADLLHFVYNPDEHHLWKGQGIQVALKDIANNLAQASATTNGFMQSKWKPSVVIKVDANAEAFASKEGRSKILDEYISNDRAGKPWIIPSDLMEIETIKPLSLNDLAIADTVTLDKKTVASVLGVPSFVLGVGDYKAEEWDSFINNTVRPIAQEIEQEMTRKLILSPKMYLMFNMSKLYSYDLQKTADVYAGLYDKGIVTGNEVREHLGMQPKNDLDDLMILENYIPVSESGNQKKLGGK